MKTTATTGAQTSGRRDSTGDPDPPGRHQRRARANRSSRRHHAGGCLGPEERQKAYTTADLRLRYQNGKGWWIAGFVRNASDEKVKTSAFNGFGPWLSQYKPPCTVGINTGIVF